MLPKPLHASADRRELSRMAPEIKAIHRLSLAAFTYEVNCPRLGMSGETDYRSPRGCRPPGSIEPEDWPEDFKTFFRGLRRQSETKQAIYRFRYTSGLHIDRIAGKAGVTTDVAKRLLKETRRSLADYINGVNDTRVAA